MKTRDHHRVDLRRRALKVALAFCLVAVGAAAYFSAHVASPILRTRTGAVSRETVSDAPVPSSDTPLPMLRIPSQEPASEATPSETPAPVLEPDVPSQETVDVVTPAASFFVMPLTGEILKGCKTDELQYAVTYGDWRLHTGLDVAGPLGAEVRAAGDGTVVSVKEDKKWGLTVVINHGNGIMATYCGLNAPRVKEGDAVEANQTLAILGEIPCESVEPVHLHLERTKENTPVDPLHIIGKRADS